MGRQTRTDPQPSAEPYGRSGTGTFHRKRSRYDLVELLYDSTPDVLSELIRTAFVAKPGCRSSSAIFGNRGEGHGIPCRRRMGHGGSVVQERSMSRRHPRCSISRSKRSQRKPVPCKGKGGIACLSVWRCGRCARQHGSIKFCGRRGTEGLVQSWRTANPHIVNYWYEIDGAVKAAVKERKMTTVGRVTVYYQSGMLKIALPSGRVLSYVRPRMTVNRFGSESVSYEGIGTNRKWTRIESYGAKFCENIVQATARDVLAEAMLRLEKKGFDIVRHIHDEVVLEVPEGHPRWKK